MAEGNVLYKNRMIITDVIQGCW